MKKNVASQKIGAQMVSASDGSAFTGSVTVYVTIDAGTQGAGSVGSGACTHEGNGYHTYAPAQAETNGDLVAFTFIGTGAVPASVQVYTSFPQTGDAYAETQNGTYGLSAIETLVDGLETAATAIEADTQDIQSRIPAALVGGRIDANMGAISADSVAADNAESFFDGTGYAGTGNVIPTVTTLTNLPAITANWLTAAGIAADAGAEIADAVWDEAIAGHAGAGSTGEALSAAGAAGDPWITALPGAYSAGQAGYIVGTNLNATVSSRASAADLSTVAGYLDTEIAAILADTNELQTDWANGGRLDLILDARASQTTADAIEADTQDIQSRIPAALASGNMKVDVLAISGSTAAADNLEESTEVIGTGTCTTGGTTTSVVASAVAPASAVNDQFNGRVMIFKGNTTAALAGQATTISDYDHATLTFTVVALTTAPASGDLFTIL